MLAASNLVSDKISASSSIRAWKLWSKVGGECKEQKQIYEFKIKMQFKERQKVKEK